MHTSLPNKMAGCDAILSERLFAIAESLPKGATVCDVGSDHGHLPLFLLKSGISPKVIVTDLNKKPLDRAKNALMEEGFFEKAEFLLTDGIEEVLPQSPDAFVIAGMGGETVIGILARALEKIPIGCTFVLQPMTKLPELRKFLYEAGFLITDETVIFENKKFFPILSVTYTGKAVQKEELLYYFGEHLPQKRSEVLSKYYQMLLSQTEAILQGKQKSGWEVSREEAIIGTIHQILEECV